MEINELTNLNLPANEMDHSLVAGEANSELGSIYTPSDYARFLATWAVKTPKDVILDLGVGEGSFVFASFNRLVELDAKLNQAQLQIYGSEIDKEAYERFVCISQQKTLSFPNITNKDFFDIHFPVVDAIVGNPPYVRRMNIQSTDVIREKVIRENQLIAEEELSRLSDLYVYFLLYALPKLKPGGRLAVITAESWLNVSYGQVLKEYLLNNFDIDCLLSLDRRVFNDAQVKPVMLLASKKTDQIGKDMVRFFRVKNGLPIKNISDFVMPSQEGGVEHQDVLIQSVKQSDIAGSHPWGTHFKLPGIFEELSNHPLMTPISSLALTRVGLQTLAKEFFVLSSAQVISTGIEAHYIKPLAQSSRYVKTPVLTPGTEPEFYIFYCNDERAALANTNALQYIISGESKEVPVRGKKTKVMGYHNKDRIQRASRRYWYDLATSLERRGIAKILIPRLIYRDFSVLWNQASFIPGELYIEFIPLPLSNIETELEVYLAILTSSVTEIMLRAFAQVYGGGTYNINPGQIKKVPILNPNMIAQSERDALILAYREYLAHPDFDRSGIDKVMFTSLGLSIERQGQLVEAVEELITIATSTKQKHSET